MGSRKREREMKICFFCLSVLACVCCRCVFPARLVFLALLVFVNKFEFFLARLFGILLYVEVDIWCLKPIRLYPKEWVVRVYR